MSGTGLRLSLFGVFDLHVDGTPANAGLAGPTRSLLQYLVCADGRLARREHLMDLFWSDTGAARRRSSLNSAIWRIKKSLRAMGAPTGFALDASAECLRLVGLDAPEVSVDSFELADALAMASTEDPGEGRVDQLVRALAQCWGMPLDGTDDGWAAIERERLLSLRSRAQGVAMRLLAERRRYNEALEIGHRLLGDDPFNESALQEVLCIHALNGQRVRALQMFDRFTHTLQSELGISPMPETRALRDYLAGDSAISRRIVRSGVQAGTRASAHLGLEQLVHSIEHSRQAIGL